MKNKLFLTIALASVVATSAAALGACGNKRNNYAYDLDFNVDVSGTTINFWAGFGSDLSDAVQDLCKEFTRLTGVTVKYESKDSYDGCLKAVTLAATQGGYPHVVVGYPDHFASYVKSNIIVRLDYYLENDVHNDTFEPDGENFSINDFYADYVKENQSVEFDRDGNPYTLGIPFNKSTEVLIYNKSFFDYCASKTELADKIYVPQTYAELESVGEAILKYLKDNNLYGTEIKDDKNNLVLDLKGITEARLNDAPRVTDFKPFSYDSQANLFITNVRQSGGEYTTFDKAKNKGYLAFDSDETREGLSYLKTLYDKNVFGIPADWGEAKYGSNPFKACKTVMTLGSSAGVANSAPTGNKFKIAAAPVPYRTADKKFVISQGANLALLDTGSRAQRVAAWQLIKFLTKYANGAFCSTTGYYPSCAYAEQAGEDGTSGLWKGYSEDSDWMDYASWVNEASTGSTTDQIRAQTAKVNLDYYVNDKLDNKWTKFVDQPFAGSAVVRETVATIPPFVFTGEKTPDQAIKHVYSVLDDYVRR